MIATKLLNDPLDYCHIVTSTTHKTMRGPRGGIIMTSDADIAKKIDKMTFPGMQGGPHMHTIAAKAAAFAEADTPEFQEYAAQIIKNAKSMEDVFRKREVRMIAGGTDNHLFLLDTITSFNATGGEAEAALDTVHITLNKNAIPEDPRGPFDPSGVRLGTPAMTTRGFKEPEFVRTAEIICDAIEARNDAEKLKELAKEVKAMCIKYPVPGV
jgi:glycine hydroxymethyltransferase